MCKTSAKRMQTRQQPMQNNSTPSGPINSQTGSNGKQRETILQGQLKQKCAFRPPCRPDLTRHGPLGQGYGRLRVASLRGADVDAKNQQKVQN